MNNPPHSGINAGPLGLGTIFPPTDDPLQDGRTPSAPGPDGQRASGIPEASIPIFDRGTHHGFGHRIRRIQRPAVSMAHDRDLNTLQFLGLPPGVIRINDAPSGRIGHGADLVIPGESLGETNRPQ